ncbi:AraC family transcriptional regulator [uncultured Vibrio sp.]|uniref:AraC family transcriptional regulator n=1 Tax=uncultured Vibrio sp. TaxID=114054 RepID=UPI0025E0A90D|nr:AraC family transcriptional regulator [uncultured Vibrio sp.]
MMKQEIKQLVESQILEEGMLETGIKGVHLFKVTHAMPCAPAVYEPTLVVILNGSKEAILDGDKYIYDSNQYLCCSVSMPVEAGTPDASPENPLLGVYISLDTKVMTELAIEMESVSGAIRLPKSSSQPQGLSLANWDDTFSDALLRLLQLGGDSAGTAILGESRLRELYYAVLKGEAGLSVRRAFGIGNEIARSIEYLSLNLARNVTIDELASKVGMSRAVFHRKFKQATRMSPIQFMKSMRLNNAAMKIAAGKNVSEAAMAVGYVSSSQFSREFKRVYGQSPKQWSQSKQLIENIA